MNNTIKFAKIDKRGIIPSKNSEDAGYDVYGVYDEDVVTIEPNETKMIGTGIASALPIDYYFQIEERGSTGSIGMKKSAGIIDSGYRGEWFIPIYNANSVPLHIVKDDIISKKKSDNVIVYPQSRAIAQAILLPVPKVSVEELDYDELKSIPSKRGTGALGSSEK